MLSCYIRQFETLLDPIEAGFDSGNIDVIVFLDRHHAGHVLTYRCHLDTHRLRLIYDPADVAPDSA
jgi:hypothetical protein